MLIVGKTDCGKYTVSGAYQIYATYGIPLDMLITQLRSMDYVIAWDVFLVEGQAEGANVNMLLTKIEAAHSDAGLILNERQRAWMMNQRTISMATS